MTLDTPWENVYVPKWSYGGRWGAPALRAVCWVQSALRFSPVLPYPDFEAVAMQQNISNYSAFSGIEIVSKLHTLIIHIMSDPSVGVDAVFEKHSLTTLIH